MISFIHVYMYITERLNHYQRTVMLTLTRSRILIVITITFMLLSMGI